MERLGEAPLRRTNNSDEDWDYAYLVGELNLAESDGEKSVKFVDRMCQTLLETF